MKDWKFYTPDGVSDRDSNETLQKKTMEQKLRQFFLTLGYEEIETPGIEFFDVYGAGNGFVPQEELFKFFDEKGRILCLRYDGTIPVARMVASRQTRQLDKASPIRVSYIEAVYRYAEIGGGKRREFTQAGLELLGRDDASTDAEIIYSAIASALAVGLKNLQISLGDISFFRALSEDWGLSESEAEQLLKYVDGKELLAVEELVVALGMSDEAKQILQLLINPREPFETLEALRKYIRMPKALQILDKLESILNILKLYDVLDYITIDLGLLKCPAYYTGLIFKGFTYGLGFPLFSGGRYNTVVESFGEKMPAVGFSMGIELALAAIERQGLGQVQAPEIKYLNCSQETLAENILIAKKYRAQGQAVIIQVKEAESEEVEVKK